MGGVKWEKNVLHVIEGTVRVRKNVVFCVCAWLCVCVCGTHVS